MAKYLKLTDALHDYLTAMSLREPDVLARLRAATQGRKGAGMQVAAEQGQFLAFLARLIGARRCLEVGVFTGYSSLAVALALPPDGRLIACDISDDHTRLARQFWAEAGVADRIDLRLAPALQTLDALLAAGEAGRFDFAFIDADKENYVDYYERVLTLLRPGGLVAIDNVLWGGSVIDATKTDAETVAIRALNEHLRDDRRVTLSMLALGDGVTLAMKL